EGEADFAPTSLAAKVRGPLAIRRLLGRLHVAEDLEAARALQAQLAEGESVITRAGERLGAGWVRVLRSGAAKQGALLREREIQALRGEIKELQHREAELERGLAAWRDRALVAEQHRQDAQRTLYLAHRSVSELGGQLQGQQGRLDSARGRIEKIDNELAQLAETLESSAAQAREARSRLEASLASMASFEDARRALDGERAALHEARDNARAA